MHTIQRVVSRFLLPFVLTCPMVNLDASGTGPDVLAKIHFDLSGFTDDGLYGPPGGLRSLSYEFCIPAHDELSKEVRTIDPTIECSARSPGRVGCARDQYLCIGNTHQPEFRAVLFKLSALDYVTGIEPSYGE